jgi:hypothetical protein
MRTLSVCRSISAQLALDLAQLPGGQIAFEDAVLHMRAVAFQEFQDAGAALIVHNIVADDGK